MAQASLEMDFSLLLLVPPFLIRDATAITEKVGAPILPPTDTPVMHFDGPNGAFPVVVSPGKACHVVTLN